MSAVTLSYSTPTAPSTLRAAVSRCAGACVSMLLALNEGDAAQRQAARDKLFQAAMSVAWLILEEDATCSTP